jgi:hypothetical protein
MARAKTFTVVGSAGGPSHSPAYPIDTYNNPCNIGIGVIVSGPLAVADVQHTFGDPWNTNLNVVSAAVWINNSTLVSATQAGATNGAYDTNYAFPPRAIRLRVRALASASVGEQAIITIQQAGPED